jgi:hypothetical protein
MNDIVIYPNKRYLLAMAAGSLLFVGASLYFIINGYNISGRDALGQFFKSLTPGIFYIGAPLFSLPLIYLCYRLLKPKPSVIINQEGIFDDASMFGAGMVRWEEIKSVFIYEIMNKKFLGIVPVNLETILARQSRFKKVFFKLGKGMAPAPFAIPAGGLPMTVEELLRKIQLYRESLLDNAANNSVNRAVN